jgi:hypothetical protein
MNIINSINHYKLTNSVIIITDPNLVYYVTFEQMYASNKTNWVSGTNYAGNIATGVVTSLFQAYSATNAIPETTIVKNGLQSIYTNQNLFRHVNSTYVLPQSTGLSFCVWCRMAGQNAGLTRSGVFGLSGNSGNNLLSLRMRSVNTFGAPYYINFTVDNAPPQSGGLDITTHQITNNVWNHYVWTISPALYGGTCTHKFYLNNVLIYTNSALLYPTNVARNNFDIGAVDGNGSNIQYTDTFRHYKKELDATEINNIYTNLDPNGLLV